MRFDLKKGACKTQTRFTDVRETWPESCSIEVTRRTMDHPQLTIPQTTFRFRPGDWNTISNPGEPLLVVMAPGPVMLRRSDLQPPQNHGPAYDVTIVTPFGVETLQWTGASILNREELVVHTGPLTIRGRALQGPLCADTAYCDFLGAEITYDALETPSEPRFLSLEPAPKAPRQR